MPQGQVFRRGVVAAPSRRALTAAARQFPSSAVTSTAQRNLVPQSTSTRAWQEELWTYYDDVPEYAFGIDWVGNLLAKATLEVHELKGGKWVRTTNQNALNIEASMFGGMEGQADALRLIATNFEVAGECWVLATPGGRGKPDVWRVASAVETHHTPGGPLVVEGVRMPDNTLPTQIYKPHPKKSTDVKSPSRALLTTLRQLTKLSLVIDAQADSRLTSAGILWVPMEMELPEVPIQISADGGETFETVAVAEGATGLYNRLIQIAAIAIQKRGSAAANVPLVISAPGEYLEKIQKTDFWSGFDKHVQSLREEARKRLAIGMDMPPEIITGTSEVNHWGAWQIEEAAIKTHTEPLLDVIVSSLGDGILRPALMGMGEANPDNFKFVANTAALRMRPNRSKEAMELWDRGELSGRTLLIENGFDPDTDSPDEKERILWFVGNLARKTSATPDQLAALLAVIGVKGVPDGVSSGTRGAEDTRSLTEHPNRSIPDPEKSEAGDEVPARGLAASGTVSAAYVLDGVLLASEVHVLRALERAGNKIKSKVGRSFTSEGTPARELYLVAPRMSLVECEELLTDAWSCLAATPYPGVDPVRLEDTLNGFALALLRRNAPYSRTALARHLLLELSEPVTA